MAWIEAHEELRDHPKTKRLAKYLKVEIPTAIGYLQCLWWWATKFAPDGDLTRYDDMEIADAAFCTGKKAAQMKDALIFAGFLDNTEDGRLMLHDWQDYGGKNIQRQKAANERNRRYRERQRAATMAQEEREKTGDVPQPSQDTAETETSAPQDGHETVTRPSQDAHTRHDMTGNDITGQETTGKDRDTPHNPPPGGEGESPPTLQDRRFEEFWAAYPKKQGKGAARKAWMKIHPDAEKHRAIMDSVAAHKAHNPQWLKDNGQYIPNPATWLNQERWTDGRPWETEGGGQDGGENRRADSGFRRSTGFRAADSDASPDG